MLTPGRHSQFTVFTFLCCASAGSDRLDSLCRTASKGDLQSALKGKPLIAGCPPSRRELRQARAGLRRYKRRNVLNRNAIPFRAWERWLTISRRNQASLSFCPVIARSLALREPATGGKIRGSHFVWPYERVGSPDLLNILTVSAASSSTLPVDIHELRKELSCPGTAQQAARPHY